MLDNIPKSTLYNQCFVRYSYLQIFAYNMSDNMSDMSDSITIDSRTGINIPGNYRNVKKTPTCTTFLDL